MLAETDPSVIRVPTRPASPHCGRGKGCSELSRADGDSLSHTNAPHLNILHR